MIIGKVKGAEARIRLRVIGVRGREREIEAVIDTGYTAALTLPRAVITALALPWRGSVRAILADGEERLFDLYEANVVWDRRRRRVPAFEAATVPLVGMALLDGHEFMMQVKAGGRVTIKRIP
jgi:clan AA aspartic protease